MHMAYYQDILYYTNPVYIEIYYHYILYYGRMARRPR